MPAEPITRSGASKLGLVFALCCVLVLAAVSLVSVRILERDYHAGYKQMRDSAQIREIHQAWTLFAGDFDGALPAPGLMNRLPVDMNGKLLRVPGRGEEDVALNTTANLYSMCIMQNFIVPEICVGPTEPNDRVQVMDEYDWDRYDPLTGAYWDPRFLADLETASHVSYAHLPLYGTRRSAWSDVVGGPPLVGNRGPRGGLPDPDSLTYRVHEPDDVWTGLVCFGDGRVELLDTFTPEGADNLFAFDDGLDGGDDILTFTKTMGENGPETQHD